MSWQHIARKDIRDAGRSKTIWLLVCLLSVLFVAVSLLEGVVGDGEFVSFVDATAGIVGTFLPLIAILVGYRSIAHPRISGSLFLSLSLPDSRKTFLVGTVVGRTVVLLVPTLGALAVAGVIAIALYGADGGLLYPWFLFATALYGGAFVAIAVGLSAAISVDRSLTLAAFGVYLLLVMVWDNLHTTTLLVLHRFDFDVLTTMPDWALLFRLVKPSDAYYRLLRAGFDIDRAGRYVGDGVPLYVDWWMGVVVLVGWIAVPLAIGYRRFRSTDL